MIRAVIFDLDGTLVQTEKLKAASYARAAVELCPECATEDEVIEAFKEVVGRSRQEVSQSLMERFGLEEAAKKRMAEFGVSTPWQAFAQIRLRIYESMLTDPHLIRENQWPRAIALLHEVRQAGYKTALATTSHCEQTYRVLDTLGLTGEFDFIATADDVEHSKPDPEIYELISRELDVPPDQCLVIEDSLPGVKAALAAGMSCIAVTTPFTRKAVDEAGVPDTKWIVDDAAKLEDVFHQMIEERSRQPSGAEAR